MLPISGWILFLVVGLVISVGVFSISASFTNKVSISLLAAFVSLSLIFIGVRWYYTNTASGQRIWVDEKSNLDRGIERVINVYTANGDLIASYEGKIDIESNDGGYIKFDFEGKRYIYYNCFVETIANINLG